MLHGHLSPAAGCHVRCIAGKACSGVGSLLAEGRLPALPDLRKDVLAETAATMLPEMGALACAACQ